jgi:hypothetical protein
MASKTGNQKYSEYLPMANSDSGIRRELMRYTVPAFAMLINTKPLPK